MEDKDLMGAKLRDVIPELPMSKMMLGLFVEKVTEYALILIDTDHRILHWNAGARLILGYDPDEIIGKNISIIFTPEDRQLDVAGKEITRSRQNGWADDERWHIRRNGKRFWANGVMSCLRSADGTVIGYSKIFRDQTQRKETEDRLKTVVASLTQFTHSAAHDLGEPMRTLSCYIELIEKELLGKVSPELESHLAFTRQAADRMKALLSNLLAYITGGQSVVVERTDTAAVFDTAVSNLRLLIEEKKAVVTRSSLPILMAVPGQLLQVFLNLISNSLKFQGADAPRVFVDAVLEKNEWVFSIRDNGVGIAPQDQAKVFEAFKRLHPQDEIPGSGLGLSICKRIVESHHGRIWIESVEGRGTTVSFTIPHDTPQNVH